MPPARERPFLGKLKLDYVMFILMNAIAIKRWRDRNYYGGPKRWLESALRDPSWQDKDDSSEAAKKREAAISSIGKSPLWLGDDLEFWPEKSGKEPVRFVKIAALHSELIAVSANGHLYQWRWCDMTPHR